MLEPQLSEARLGFIAPCPSDRSEFAINRDRRFPIVCFLEQMCGVEAGLIKTKKFVLQIGARAFFQHPVVGR